MGWSLGSGMVRWPMAGDLWSRSREVVQEVARI